MPSIQTLPVDVQLMVARFLPREERARNVGVSKVFLKFMDHSKLWSEVAAKMGYKVDKDPKQDFFNQHVPPINKILLGCLPDAKAKPLKELNPLAQREALEKHISDKNTDFSRLTSIIDFLNQLPIAKRMQFKLALKLLFKHGLWIYSLPKLFDDPDFHQFFDKWCEGAKKRQLASHPDMWDWAIKQPDPTNYINALVEAGTFPIIPNIVNGIMRIVLSKTPEERKNTESIFATMKDKALLAEIQKTITLIDAWDSEVKKREEGRASAQQAISSYYQSKPGYIPTTYFSYDSKHSKVACRSPIDGSPISSS